MIVCILIMIAVSFIDILMSIANSMKLLIIKYYNRWEARGKPKKVAHLEQNEVELQP